MKKIKILLFSLLTTLLLSACGNQEAEDTKLKNFQDQLQTICDNIETLDEQMNAIDPESDQASATMLSYLNQLSAEFEDLSKLELPSLDYTYVSTLSQEACDYMDDALTLYFEILGKGIYTDETSTLAYENYSRACKRIQVIVSLLHGEIPEDATVSYE